MHPCAVPCTSWNGHRQKRWQLAHALGAVGSGAWNANPERASRHPRCRSGLLNRGIAQAVFITTEPVAHHLASSYSNLVHHIAGAVRHLAGTAGVLPVQAVLLNSDSERHATHVLNRRRRAFPDNFEPSSRDISDALPAHKWQRGKEGAAQANQFVMIPSWSDLRWERVIEYTLISADGGFENPVEMSVGTYQDDASLRDGLNAYGLPGPAVRPSNL